MDALRTAARVWRFTGSLAPTYGEFSPASLADFHQDLVTDATVQAAGGLKTTINYTDKNAITVGAEYFYNGTGSETPVSLSWNEHCAGSATTVTGDSASAFSSAGLAKWVRPWNSGK